MALTTRDPFRSATLLPGRSSTIHEQIIRCIYGISNRLCDQRKGRIVLVFPGAFNGRDHWRNVCMYRMPQVAVAIYSTSPVSAEIFTHPASMSLWVLHSKNQEYSPDDATDGTRKASSQSPNERHQMYII